MDAADREPGGHGHGHRIEVEASLLPLKKRASNYSSGGGRISAGGDPYYATWSKKKRMETKDTTAALEAPPVPRQRRPVRAAASRERERQPAAPPPAASPEPADEEEKKRLSKGKWLAKDQSSSSSNVVRVTPQPPVKKLMHDGIRSFVPQHQHQHQAHHHAAAADAPDLGKAVEQLLARLGATRPWLVHTKTLRKSDVDENQNRLLVSCKRGSGADGCPITPCFSPAERERVEKKEAGLWVTAFDRDARQPYLLTCKFLGSNNAYRFITDWKKFLTRNGMNLGSQKHKEWKRDVEVELWAFRSRQLPFQPQLDADGRPVTTEDDNNNKWISHHLDADGSLAFLLLLHENRSGRVKSKEEDDEDDDDDDDWKEGPSVARKKGKQQSGKWVSSASASPAALPAPVAEQGVARRSDDKTFCAAVGLAMLRQCTKERWLNRRQM